MKISTERSGIPELEAFTENQRARNQQLREESERLREELREVKRNPDSFETVEAWFTQSRRLKDRLDSVDGELKAGEKALAEAETKLASTRQEVRKQKVNGFRRDLKSGIQKHIDAIRQELQARTEIKGALQSLAEMGIQKIPTWTIGDLNENDFELDRLVKTGEKFNDMLGDEFGTV